MTIETRSQFYYIDSVDENNFRIDFDEGLGEIVGEVEVGSYSMEELMLAVEKALNVSGDLDYTVTLDRLTRLVTISATGTFDLLVSTGSSGLTAVYTLLGFTGSDRTGLSSYEGDTAIGSVYRPQFLLQEFIGFDDWSEAISASVNESASGIIEVITFGNRRFMEFNDRFITNIDQGSNSVIETNLNGVNNSRSFMNFIINKSNLEFMPDRDDPNTFDTVLLESTTSSSEGTGFKLNEMYSQGIANYYETGKLKFRKVVI